MSSGITGGILRGRENVPDRVDDHRLAAGCASGDAGVIDEIYQRFGERMKSIAWNHLGNMTDAEDAIQETFIKLHRSSANYSGEASFGTWAFRILVNTCLDMLRQKKRRIEVSPLETLVTEQRGNAVDDTKRMTLRKLLDALPAQKRSVFTLFEIEGLSHAEIGAILGISEGNSKWILFSTKKELQEKWRQQVPAAREGHA